MKKKKRIIADLLNLCLMSKHVSIELGMNFKCSTISIDSKLETIVNTRYVFFLICMRRMKKIINMEYMNR